MDKNLVESVSIVMPAFNAAKYIADSILSVQQQTFHNWELIVIDDGSTDSTAQIVKSFQERDSRIIYSYQKNQRLGAARNAATRRARGKYLAFLDSDDLWFPEKLEKQIATFGTMDVDFIFSNGYVLEDTNLLPYPTIDGSFSGSEMYEMLYDRNCIPVLSVMVKKEWIDLIGFQEEQAIFFGCEDWDYWLRFAKAGAKFHGMNEKLFKYRKHSTNMSGNNFQMKLAQASALVKNFSPGLSLEKVDLVTELLDSLIPNLIKMGRREDVLYLLTQINENGKAKKYVWMFRLVKYFGGNSYWPLRIFGKLTK